MRSAKQPDKWTSRVKSALLVSCSLSLAAIAAPAHAQADQAQPDETQDAAPQGGLQDIVVTARKRSETAQTAPVAVTALSGEQLTKYSITSLEQVAAATPQLQVSRAVSGSAANISLRGIGSSFSSVGIEQSVAIIVDGVYYGSGQVLNEGLFDASRIEILKGPQALFFGKNATAGAISVTTADPTDKFEAMGRVGYELGAKNLSGEGYISGPLTDTLSARLAVRYSHMFGGYYRNGAEESQYTTFDAATGATSILNAQPSENWGPQEKQAMARLTLKWTPSSQLTARLKIAGDIDRTNDTAWNAVPICAGATMQLAPTQTCNNDFIRYAVNAPPEVAATLPGAKSNGALFNRYKSYSITGAVDYNAGNVNITSVTNYNWNKNVSAPSYNGEAPFIGIGGGGWGTEISRRDAFSTEARALTTFDSPVNVMVGAYYQKTKFVYDAAVAFAGVENSAVPEWRYVANAKHSYTNGETIALYGQAIWKIVPTVELNAGVRYTHETKDSYFIQVYSNPLLSAIYIPNVPITANQSWDNWSPDVTVTWRPRSNITVYGGYKTGYKSGGFSNSGILGGSTPVGGLEFEPETARGFEGGIKTTLFDNQLRFNVGLYRYRFSDLQIDFWNSAIATLITTNAGAAVTKGVEIETQWSPRAIPGFDLHGTLNYNKARYKNYDGPCWNGQTIAQGCTILGPGGAPFQDLSGKPTANAPAWTASFGFNYAVPVNDSLEARISADGRYSDRYNFSSVYDPIAFQKSYVVLDAAASISAQDDHWELALIGKNLTDKRFIGTDWETTNTGGGTGTTVGTKSDLIGFGNIPRTVELRFTWRY